LKKLTTEEVSEIKDHLKQGKLTQKEIATLYKVSQSSVSSINRKRTFRYIVSISEEYQRGYRDGYARCLKDHGLKK
jgi:predicted transcriptional regulator